jgi:hypothetical protein
VPFLRPINKFSFKQSTDFAKPSGNDRLLVIGARSIIFSSLKTPPAPMEITATLKSLDAEISRLPSVAIDVIAVA